MFIYHFNRLIVTHPVGILAIIIAIAFVAVDSCFKPQDAQSAGTINGKNSYDQFDRRSGDSWLGDRDSKAP